MGTLVARPSVRRWIVAGPVIAFLLVGVGVSWAVPDLAETVGFLGMIAGYLLAGALFMRRSRRLQLRERSAWRILGAGTMLVGVGIVVVGVLTEAGVDLPAFGATDIFFLAGYSTLVVAIYRLARAEGDGQDWLPTLLDATVGGIALAALVWTALFRPLVDAFSEAPAWERAIAVTYPLLDIAAIVGLMILVIRRSHFHLDLRLVFLAAGLAVQVLNDLIFLSRGLGRSFEEADPVWPLLLLTAAMLVTAAAIVDRVPRKREFPEEETPMWAMVWPYLLVASLVAVHVTRYRALEPAADEIILLDALIVIGVLVFLRQMLIIHRNRKRVERQRSELVASVSHELRTPLTAMVGYLTLLDEEGGDFPEGARMEMISEATGQARHMARLVSDLVMLARGDHRHLPLELNDVTVTAIVTAALRSVESDHTIIEDEVLHDATVRVDSDRVQQALANTLSNAVRYGGDRALVVARIEESDLVLETHDNGEGVPTRYETVIWRRFERGAHRLNAATPGLGIGLAIVDAVAESHGGTASYRRSERLGGACFSLVIPGCVVPHSSRQVPVGTGG